MKPENLFLLRHGQTNKNVEDRLDYEGKANYCHMKNGNPDLGLNGKGREQAKKVASGLKGRFRIDRIISSPLARAIQTAEAVARAYVKKIEIDDRIREREFPDFEKYTRLGMKKFMPEELEEQKKDTYRYRPRGGESYEDVVRRTKAFYAELLERNASESVLVVSHHSSILALVMNIENLSPEETTRLARGIGLNNAALVHYVLDRGKYRRDAYNEVYY